MSVGEAVAATVGVGERVEDGEDEGTRSTA